ncbi:MAG: aldehyde dehydrogenase family protein [Deltaproteobacteria bacterium]|jgi:acetaldehyde dehydrogenase / alcohol dehydrogenase|nr:aldehyde dehydrogenase family protein [Deltaproteobacteria bacterium]
MSDAIQKANEYVQNAVLAEAVFNEIDQESTDRIVEAVYRAALSNRVRLARMAVEETCLGVFEDKVIKNVVASQLVYENIKNEKTVGIISHDELRGVTEFAQPLGPILAVVPITNPTSTVIFKCLIALKTRNPIIISPHRRAAKSSGEAAKICYEAALSAGAPDDCIQWITECSRDLTHGLMSHPKLGLLLATGGPGLVNAAYSSGTPAIGVGAGNVPVFIEKSAEIPFAVRNIITSKSFDNGTVCASEQAVVVEEEIADLAKAEFEKQGCYFMNSDEMKAVEKIIVKPDTDMMNPDIVGQSATFIAEMAKIKIPSETKILMAPQEKVGSDYPFSGEILAPILAFYGGSDFQHALKLCIDLNYRGGIGHTASIYSNDESAISHFAELMNAGRVVVNTPSSQGGVGGIYNTLNTSFTLGCGSGGKNITTENITAKHLINIKKLCRRRDNAKMKSVPAEIYYDEKIDVDEIIKAYNKNS